MLKKQMTLLTVCAFIVALAGLLKENTLNADYYDRDYNRSRYYNDPYYRRGVVGGSAEVAGDTASGVWHGIFGGPSRSESRYDYNVEQENDQLQYENEQLRNR